MPAAKNNAKRGPQTALNDDALLALIRAAVAAFVHSYNHHWRLEKLHYQSPIQARPALHSALPLAA